MHPADIKAALEKRGYNQTRVADDLHVSASHVHMVIHGDAISLRVAERVGKILGRSPRELWPGVYDDRVAA
jgi:lambda repressor-like predicted transcriptional regulator